jgi:hypothetical protein
MRSSNLVILGAAIAVVALAAVGAVALLTREPPPAPAASAGAPADGAPAPGAPAAAPAEPPPPAALPPSPAPAASPQQPVAAALRDPWDTVPFIGRSRTGFGRELEAAVAELEGEVGPCFDPAVRSRYRHVGVSEYRGQDGAGESGDASLVLEIEVSTRGVRIAGAPVESRGGLEDDVLACAQQRIAGRELAVEGAPPGARYKLRFPVAR